MSSQPFEYKTAHFNQFAMLLQILHSDNFSGMNCPLKQSPDSCRKFLSCPWKKSSVLNFEMNKSSLAVLADARFTSAHSSLPI